MRPKENYGPLVAIALVLTLAILTSFQVYILREPTRIAADEARDKLLAVSAGRSLFADNCAICHGENGEGADGPALNDRQFLAETHDDVMFNLISSGVPGSEMPAWNQAHGGPFTDQQVRQIVAFIRSWEVNAPDRRAQAMRGDPVKGLVIFSSTCFVCHGENGQGSARAPALNDPAKLTQFDDEWYIDTIASGRPAKGMPTWGTVLSPAQIRDIVALLRAWQRGETVKLPGPSEHLHEAMHMLEHRDLDEAEHHLEEAAKVASGEQWEAINAALAALKVGDLDAARQAIAKAESLGEGEGADGGMPKMPGDDTSAQPGEKEARAALDELNMGMSDTAVAKLKVALALAQGDLKQAIEHALEDLAAGKPDEAREVLERALSLQP